MSAFATARLRLAPLREDDLNAFHAMNQEPAVRRFLFDDEVWTLDQTAERLMAENARLWHEDGRGLFTIREQPGGPLLGWVGFWYFHEPPELELGYALHPAAWGRLVATEAAQGVMAWAARALGDEAFRASTDAPNEGSIRVLRRLGFAESRRSRGRVHETVHFVRVGVPPVPLPR